MPFCKRTILPKDVCKPDGSRRLPLLGELADVCVSSLGSVLRQLSDLSRHSVSILEELEGELVSVCLRSGALEARVVRLQRHVAAVISKPPPRGEFTNLASKREINTRAWLWESVCKASAGELWFLSSAGSNVSFFTFSKSVVFHY